MRTIVIGAGHNGLAAAFYLARRGIQTLVLEARDEVGGGAITTEMHPGFRCPTLTHEVLLHERVLHEMALHHHGLRFTMPQVDRCVVRLDGPPTVLYRDTARTATELGRRSRNGVESYLSFRSTMDRLVSVLVPLLESPPPRMNGVHAGDALTLLAAGRRFRALSRADAHRLLRWITSPIADVVESAFDDQALQAAVAGPALIGTRLGPRAAGTMLLLGLREAHRRLAGGGVRVPLGGPGAVTAAMASAAAAAGARIETKTPVDRILLDGSRVRGVATPTKEHPADIIVSAIDPKTTWSLAGEPAVDPAMTRGIQHYRARGAMAKINLALAGLPVFENAADAALLDGRIQIGPTLEFLERASDAAKYGEISAEPWLDITLPSVVDPNLAPRGTHVASIYAHYVPRDMRSDDWASVADSLLATVVTTLERHAPGLGSMIVDAQVITPRVLQREFGLAGGHVFHGELALDQLFGMRPVFGYGRYRTPIQGLYLCSAGTHPGGFMTGASGRLAAREVLRFTKDTHA